MASKIKVDQLETADGTGTIALQNQLSGMTNASMPTGSVLQVVEATPTYSSSNTNSTSYVDVISASITPVATTSKIMVYFSTSANTTTSTGNNTSFTLFRGSTNTSGGNGDCVSRKDSDGTGNPFTAVINKLDSPSTASSVTYTVKCKQESSGGDTYYSYQGGGTFLTLMEIAG